MMSMINKSRKYLQNEHKKNARLEPLSNMRLSFLTLGRAGGFLLRPDPCMYTKLGGRGLGKVNISILSMRRPLISLWAELMDVKSGWYFLMIVSVLAM